MTLGSPDRQALVPWPVCPGWQDLTTLLRMERSGPDAFRAPVTMTGHGTLFGGLVAAFALLGAGKTVAPGRVPHSLHAYFLRRGDDTPMLDITVTRVRDGRAFAVREARVYQGRRLLLTATASFHHPEPGDEWAGDLAVPPGPDETAAIQPTQQLRDVASPFEVRHIAAARPDGFVPLHPMWLRHRAPLPDDPLTQAAALTYISDLGVVMDARPPESTLPHDFIGTSLDHTVWFHRPAQMDRWLLLESEPLSSGRGRALTHARVRDREGRLLATVLQEGLHRRPRP
ncbi:thioesterase family protein [Yinghuangia sp. ASG 101]|uniref:acyl-CoA thioesterase n=1 Tax=Yinghuangia sp. ASG 101 TaxID=2896848 RepID=UPI001E4307A2|nr:acyl-CoA thioesterase domain-containing protein [Yinghuangia sp. ASG 101]UGQ11248.1 thioesterase family protein [Yinghuangia sp. ASG 101]